MMKKIFAGIVAVSLVTAALAQNAGTVTNHAYAIGKGPGVTGYTSLLCASGQLAIGSATDPTCRTMSGDATLSAAGVLTLATANASVGTFGSATQSSQVALDAKGRVTSATSLTVTPAVGSITGLGTGIGAALAINVGSAGAPVLFNGAGGTPTSLVGTNITGTATGLTVGNATKLATARAIGIAGSTGLSATGVNFDGTAAINPALTGTLAVANGGTNYTGGAWTTYTPNLGCSAGTLTSAAATGHFLTIGKFLVYNIDIVVTNVGTCSSFLTVDAPALAGFRSAALGRNNNTGRAVLGTISAASSALALTLDAGTFPVASAQSLTINGTYESQ